MPAGLATSCLPPSVRWAPEAEAEYHTQMAQMQAWYEGWQKRLGDAGEKSNEDARFVLPGACETRVLLTMNARELRHFFSLRMCSRAQWEIRELGGRNVRLVLPRGARPVQGRGAPDACAAHARRGKSPAESRRRSARLYVYLFILSGKGSNKEQETEIWHFTRT